MPIRPIEPADLPRILAMNQASARETSELDADGLERLIETSWLATVVGAPAAFLVVMDETADYDSPNFRWFRTRYDRFVYVDRIVVSADARGQGLARRLYEDLFERARAAGHGIVGCEVNKLPPNPGSDAFHAALGFREVGEAILVNGKTVRYLVRNL